MQRFRTGSKMVLKRAFYACKHNIRCLDFKTIRCLTIKNICSAVANNGLQWPGFRFGHVAGRGPCLFQCTGNGTAGPLSPPTGYGGPTPRIPAAWKVPVVWWVASGRKSVAKRYGSARAVCQPLRREGHGRGNEYGTGLCRAPRWLNSPS
jgi:hypothetical protein